MQAVGDRLALVSIRAAGHAGWLQIAARVAIALAAFIGQAPAIANELCGTAGSVIDGNTFVLAPTTNTAQGAQRRGDAVTVRIAFIDAPEADQTGGFSAKVELIRLIEHRAICVADLGRDNYSRVVGLVYADEADIGLAMIGRGVAWYSRRYAERQQPDDRARYDTAENSARNARKGVWSEANPTPPWEWRRQKATANGSSGVRQ